MISLMAGLLVMLSLPVLSATPASAASTDELLQIEKKVDVARPTPGQVFTYTVQVKCSEQDCLDAQLVDELPDELIGFQITGATANPSASTMPRTITWQPGGTSTPPATITADTKLTVDLKQVTDDPVGVGLNNGSTFTVQISIKVPEDYPPGDSGPIVNAASVSATNAKTVADDATININSVIKVATAVDKTWEPATQAFNPGKLSEIGLDIRNASNVAVQTMTIQEPKDAPDGATTLAASNPFTITDFSGFNDVALPVGCATVGVDAYAWNGSSWNWVSGTPTATPTTLAIPDGVTNANLGGVRVTCTGSMAPGTKISLDLDVKQRATHRNDGADLSTDEHTVANVTTGQVRATGQPNANDDGNASFKVTPATPGVETSKDIESSAITAGQSTTATITGTNGDLPVSTMHLADLNFFTSEMTFGGFTAAPVWPTGATSAKITYHPLVGIPYDVAFAKGGIPNAPSGKISGFEITWQGGTIAANATGTIKFAINTTENAVTGDTAKLFTNTVIADVRAPNGQTATSSAFDTISITNPRLSVTLDKQVRPSSAVEPGETVITSLKANSTAHGDGAVAHDIVIEDKVGTGSTEFWNAFNLKSIASTQVPGGTELTIEVQDPSGAWKTLKVFPSDPDATVVQMSAAEVTAALATLTPSLTSDQIKGIRFSFHNDAGFPADTTVEPNIVFAARSTMRDTGLSVTPGGTGASNQVAYKNAATVTNSGVTAGGKPLSDDDPATGDATVITRPGGPGPIDIEKDWNKESVSAQSDEQAGTSLTWKVGSGLSPVVISDPASGEATPVNTVFNAFDLVALNAIASSNTPYTSGWYLKYDTVTKVELFKNGAWVEVPAPAGSWMTATRGFKGYTLGTTVVAPATQTERELTQGIRITLEETAADKLARDAAQAPGADFDAFAPESGSGVGSGSSNRVFGLNWQLRNIPRVGTGFVVADRLYNAAGEGVVDNTTKIVGTPVGGGPAVTDTDNDTIQILNPPPGVDVTKSVTPTANVFTPPITTPQANYPTAKWTLTGKNTSTARASYLRMTDPATCTNTTLAACQTDPTAAAAVANPFTLSGDYLTNTSAPNPFERFNATKLTIASSQPAQVSAADSVVWLLHFNSGVYSVTEETIASANALSAAQLADVVGFSVTFQGADPDVSGGTIKQDNTFTITIDSQLRKTLRSSDANQVLRAGETLDVTNRVFGQSYDPVAAATTKTGDVADAKVTLTGGVINITPTKSVSPALINEPKPDVPVTVTLGANQGSGPKSTLSPNVVTIEDQAKSPDFWNQFNFTDLGAVKFPEGADRVQVSVYNGTGWIAGATAATAVLPTSVDKADIQGIRFTFSTADGALFSSNVPSDDWSAQAKFQVTLRSVYRVSPDVTMPIMPMAFDHNVTNTQSSQATRTDTNNSLVKDATSTITLSPGTHELDVHKLTNEGVRTANAGETVPYDLTFKNVGTGFLTIDELRDVLPEKLLYTGDPAPVYTKDADGTLSDEVTVAQSSDGKTLTFTWPEGGQQMQPDESFTIRIFLELQPGLASGAKAINTMVVETVQPLIGCYNQRDEDNLTNDWDTSKQTCGTTDFIGTTSGSNLFTIKGVRGSVAGAHNPLSPTAVCLPNLTATGGNYYRSPCAANSRVDGTDDWVLRAVNAGTVTVDNMTIFDQLPVLGDKTIVTGGARGSAYRPQLVKDSVKVTAPHGIDPTVEATTSANACVGTWTNLKTQAPCEQQGEVWVDIDDPDLDWAKVTGIRVKLDFANNANSATKFLDLGEAVDVTFSTVNKLQTAQDVTGASAEVPASDQFAWNQHGVKYLYTGDDENSRIAPSKVGVHLQFGQIEVNKAITGPAKDYASSDFTFDVACTAGGVPLDLGADSTVTLRPSNDYTMRIPGIPLSALGTSCTVEESGDLGEFGETARSNSPVTLAVTQASDPAIDRADEELPASQVTTITNDYQFTGLTVTKKVDTEATGATFGPFDFTLKCQSALGAKVVLDEVDDGGQTPAPIYQLDFSLQDGATWTAPTDRIPVGADCTVTEVGSSNADHIVVTGDNVADQTGGVAIVTPGVDPAAVVFTNGYDAGTITVAKVVDGAGAARYGTGVFTFAVKCTYRTQAPFDGVVELRGGETKTLGPFPAGTSCVVKETKAAGATSTTMDPADGAATIVGGRGPVLNKVNPRAAASSTVSDVTVTATNTFDLTSFDVVKKIAGDTTVKGAKGPFEIAVACTWLVDGKKVALEVPGGDTRKLSQSNGFRTSFADLPSSAECMVTETDAKGAGSTSIVSVIKGRTTKIKGDEITVALAATDGPGQALVTITNKFKSNGVLDDEDDEDDNGVLDDENGILPGTGAAASMWTLLAALLLVGGGAAVVRRGRKA